MSEISGRQGAEVVRDDNSEVVAHGFHVHHDDEDQRTDERRAERKATSRALVPSLMGLTADAAQEAVDQHPGLSVLFMYPGRGYPTTRRLGQIYATVTSGLVVSAH